MLSKNGRLFDSNIFLCLFLLHKVHTKCDRRKKKQVTLAVAAWVCYDIGHHFIYLGEIRSQCPLWNWPGVNIGSDAKWGMASTVWQVDAIHPPRIWSQVATTRGSKASCGSYLRVYLQPFSDSVELRKDSKHTNSSVRMVINRMLQNSVQIFRRACICQSNNNKNRHLILRYCTLACHLLWDSLPFSWDPQNTCIHISCFSSSVVVT